MRPELKETSEPQDGMVGREPTERLVLRESEVWMELQEERDLLEPVALLVSRELQERAEPLDPLVVTVPPEGRVLTVRRETLG